MSIVKASYVGQFAKVEYDDELCDSSKIKTAIKSAGYSTESSNDYKFMGVFILVAAVIMLGMKTSGFDMEAKLANASYAVLLSKGYTKKILKFSGVLIIVVGFIMGNRGFALAGVNINPMPMVASKVQSLLGGSSSASASGNIAKATVENGVQVIRMTANNNGYTPNAFYVQKGMPVKWIINGEQLNSCNNSIVASSVGIEKKIKKGESIVEFTPGDKDINFSCWMGMIRGVIKVVDNLETVNTSNTDASIPPPSTGPSCCAVPLDEESEGASSAQSIYGDDITKVPTDTLINKASALGNYQSVKFKGIGYELQPLIVVTGNTTKTKLTFDLSDFDNVEGKYLIVDAITGDEITSFNAKKGVNEVEFSPKKVGGYAIVKDDFILGIIEVVDNLDTADLEKMRDTYLSQ